MRPPKKKRYRDSKGRNSGDPMREREKSLFRHRGGWGKGPLLAHLYMLMTIHRLLRKGWSNRAIAREIARSHPSGRFSHVGVIKHRKKYGLGGNCQKLLYLREEITSRFSSSSHRAAALATRMKGWFSRGKGIGEGGDSKPVENAVEKRRRYSRPPPWRASTAALMMFDSPFWRRLASAWPEWDLPAQIFFERSGAWASG